MLRWSAPEETRPAMSISRYAQSRAQPDFRTSTLKSSPSACTGTRVAPLARACSSAIADCCRASPFTPRHRRARWYRARPSSLVQLVARPPSHIDDRLLCYALEQRAPSGFAHAPLLLGTFCRGHEPCNWPAMRCHDIAAAFAPSAQPGKASKASAAEMVSSIAMLLPM